MSKTLKSSRRKIGVVKSGGGSTSREKRSEEGESINGFNWFKSITKKKKKLNGSRRQEE